MALPSIRGTQIGLRNPAMVDSLKSEMQLGTYIYNEERGQIGGVIDRYGIYHVIEGHHRMVAALEILYETGDDKPLLNLLHWGRWSRVDVTPLDSRPFPSRSTWRAFRNWLGF